MFQRKLFLLIGCWEAGGLVTDFLHYHPLLCLTSHEKKASAAVETSQIFEGFSPVVTMNYLNSGSVRDVLFSFVSKTYEI